MAMEIGHVHIKTYDPKKTAQFYIDNFGATLKNEAPNGNIQLNLHGLQLNVTTISRGPEPQADDGDRTHRGADRRLRRRDAKFAAMARTSCWSSSTTAIMSPLSRRPMAPRWN